MQIYFKTDDEEAYHQALVLVGDKKALAINNLRKWDGFYDAELQTVVNYVLNYIDESEKLGSKVAYERHCKKISSIYTSTIPKEFWKNIVNLVDTLPKEIPFYFTQLALVPFMRSSFEKKDDKHLPPS